MAEPTTAEDVVVAALCAQDAMRYEAVVALVDRESMAELHRRLCEAARPIAFERFASNQTGTPEETAARYEAYRRLVEDRTRNLRGLPPGMNSLAELEAADPADYLLHALQKDDYRLEIVKRMHARGRPVPNYVHDFLERRRHEVLGSVAETPDLAHVLYRTVVKRDDGPDFLGQVEFVSVRRQPDGAWRLLVEDWHFLQPRGGSVVIIDEEFMDLYDDAEWSAAPTEPPAS